MPKRIFFNDETSLLQGSLYQTFPQAAETVFLPYEKVCFHSQHFSTFTFSFLESESEFASECFSVFVPEDKIGVQQEK